MMRILTCEARCTRPVHASFSSCRRASSVPVKRAVNCGITAPERAVHAGSSNPAPLSPDSVKELDVPTNGFDSIPDALEAIAAGEFVVVLDDANRENEGDLIIAADKVTPEKVAFMVEHTTGVLCAGLQGSDCDRLRLPLMVSSAENEESMYTAFTVTVDLRAGVSTGISASDRAKTLAALGNPHTTPEDLRKPGHIFPLRSREGGVLARPGHTEAAVDLAYYAGCVHAAGPSHVVIAAAVHAGCYPAGVLCELVDRLTGEMARTPLLQAFAREHALKCITIADLIRYRLKREVLLRQTASVALATRYGAFRAVGFESLLEHQEHLVLVHGDVKTGRPLVRIHEEDVIGDVFGVELCDGQPELDAVLKAIIQHGSGILIYLSRRANNGTRIASSLRHLQALQDACQVDPDLQHAPKTALDVRDMGNVHSVLQGIRASPTITLVTDDQADVARLQSFGHGIDMLRLSKLL